jgi:hypothetical protein
LILSELCRDKNDLHRPFREAIARQANYNQFAYQSINLREIPSLSNTFAALSFEDFDNAAIASINNNNSNMKEKESPIEKIIKY